MFARTFPHSVILTLIFGLLVALQQFVIPWIIPGRARAMTHTGAAPTAALAYSPFERPRHGADRLSDA